MPPLSDPGGLGAAGPPTGPRDELIARSGRAGAVAAPAVRDRGAGFGLWPAAVARSRRVGRGPTALPHLAMRGLVGLPVLWEAF